MTLEPDMKKAVSEVTAPTEEGPPPPGGPESPPGGRDRTGRFTPGQHGPGRPKGKKGKTAAKPAAKKPATPPPDPGPSPDEIKLVGYAAAGVWRIAGKYLKLSPLSNEEAEDLGAVLIPVLEKYLPGLDAWAPEFALAATVLFLVEAHRVEDAPLPVIQLSDYRRPPEEPTGPVKPVKFPAIPPSAPVDGQ